MVAPIPSVMGVHCLNLLNRKEDPVDQKSNSKSLKLFLKALPNAQKQEITEIYTAENSFLSNRDIRLLEKHCPHVEKLNLSFAIRVDDTAVKIIADNFKNIQELNLCYVRNIGNDDSTITDDGVDYLLSNCKKLSKLDITGSSITFNTFKSVIAASQLTYLVMQDAANLRISNYKEFEKDIQLLLSLRNDLTFVDEKGEHAYSAEQDPYLGELYSANDQKAEIPAEIDASKKEPVKHLQKDSAIKNTASKKSVPQNKASKMQEKKTGFAAKIGRILTAPIRFLSQIISSIFFNALTKLGLKKTASR